MLNKLGFFTILFFSLWLGAFEVVVSDSYRDALYRLNDANNSGYIEPDEIEVVYNDDAEGPDLSTPDDMELVDGELYLLDGGTLDTIFRLVDKDSDNRFFLKDEAEIYYGPGCSNVKLRTPNSLAYLDEMFAIADDSTVKGQVVVFQDIDGDGGACMVEESRIFYDSLLAEGTSAPKAPESICILADSSILVSDATTGEIFRLKDLDQDGMAVSVEEISVLYSPPPGESQPDFSCIISYKNGLLASDRENGGVLYLEDKNGDGIVEEDEASVFCGNGGSSVYIGEPEDLWIDDLGNIWLVDNATDLVYFVSDRNGDGDALDVGEVLPVFKDGTVLTRPVSLVVKGAPQGSAPVAGELSAASGSIDGGDEVLITGENFSTGSMVFFGDIPATEVELVDSQTLRVVTPSGSGRVSVTVASVNGISTLPDSWTFEGASFAVNEIVPSEGSSAGGYSVTITGNGLEDADVWFDGVQVEISKRSMNELVVIVPSHESGEIAILVGNGFQEFTLPFLYSNDNLFVRGDVDADGSIALNDAILILSDLFADGTFPNCKDRADINDDGFLNIADAVSLLSYLFSGGNQPPQPFPDPGADNTPDDLDCL